MIFNMTSGGSSGLVLNFSVKAYASESDLPEISKENTIAVFTNTEITSWVFDFSEPKSPSNGMVWFLISDTSDIDFNALKKNDIQMHVAYARQYISGKWMPVTSKIYQNGVWITLHAWTGQLYSSGDEFEPITGGWLAFAYPGNQYLTATTPTVTKYNNRMKITLSGSAVGGAVVTKNTIDFTNFKTLTYTVSEHNTGSDNQINIVVNDEFNNNVVIQRCYYSGTFTIDVSSLRGMHRVGIHLATVSGSATVSLNSMTLS